MFLGLSLSAFTTLHVILSLVAMFAGIVVLLGMLAALRLGFWAWLFLVTAILTSATGYLFPGVASPALAHRRRCFSGRARHRCPGAL